MGRKGNFSEKVARGPGRKTKKQGAPLDIFAGELTLDFNS